MNEITKAAEEATTLLYETFRVYRLRPGHPIPCGCGCIRPDRVERLHSKPMQELSSKDLDAYAWKAMTTWGDVADFKHYLPRIFEVMLFAAPNREELTWCYGFRTPLQKLIYGEWRTWPVEEQIAIENFLRVVWRNTLINESNPTETWYFFVNIVLVIQYLHPLLQECLEYSRSSRNALVALADLASVLGDDGTLYELSEAQITEVMNWFLSSHIRELLEVKFYEAVESASSDDDLLEQLSTAIDRLNMLQRNLT